MRDNQRVINTLSVIARAIFDYEYKQHQRIDGIFSMGSGSKFRAIFLLIQNNQSQNFNFEKLIIREMIQYMY